MEWVRENWFFILIFIFFMAMHSFGGCMGGHGRHGKEDHEHGVQNTEEAEKKEKKGGHGC